MSVNANCTGELISSNTVLTAAHCVCHAGTCGTTASIRLRFEPSTQLPWKPGADNWLVGRVRVHPSYSGGKQYDLATITFDASAPGYASPFTVSSSLPEPGSEIMIAGYGLSGPGCSIDPPDPNKAPFMSPLFWDGTHFDGYKVYPYCPGDSGGAALEDDGSLNPRR